MSRYEERYGKVDFLRAENALQLVQALSQSIDDPVLLASLAAAIGSVAADVDRRASGTTGAGQG